MTKAFSNRLFPPFLALNHLLDRRADDPAGGREERRSPWYPHELDLPLYDPANPRGFFWGEDAGAADPSRIRLAAPVGPLRYGPEESEPEGRLTHVSEIRESHGRAATWSPACTPVATLFCPTAMSRR